MRILIAEDDQVLADGLLRSLRNSGYAVDQVGSGSEADAALSSHEFDLVILDLVPPGCSLEVLKRLRGRGTSTRCPSSPQPTARRSASRADLEATTSGQPFSLRGTEARVQALTRRGLGAPPRA
jgi:two-component system OmpR family response regulator